MVFGSAPQVAKGLAGPVISSATGGVVSTVAAANALPALGFGAAGVKAASIAAGVQSCWFAKMTSMGATGSMAGPLAAGPVGAVAGGVAWYYLRRSK